MGVFSTISSAFLQGGVWMWVILTLQLVSFAIMIERVFSLYMKKKIGELNFAESLEKDIKRGNLKDIYDNMEREQQVHPLAGAVKAGTKSAMNLGGKEEIKGKMDEVLISENAKLEKRTGFLSMLANVGTLTGLLGTIVGMIQSFAAVSYANPTEKAALLSSGISVAMNTTAYGLIMAIPAIIMYSVLSNRTNDLAEDLNQGALKVFNWLSYAYEPTQIRGARKERKERGSLEPTTDA